MTQKQSRAMRDTPHNRMIDHLVATLPGKTGRTEFRKNVKRALSPERYEECGYGFEGLRPDVWQIYTDADGVLNICAYEVEVWCRLDRAKIKRHVSAWRALDCETEEAVYRLFSVFNGVTQEINLIDHYYTFMLEDAGRTKAA